jgi:archaemetzincin
MMEIVPIGDVDATLLRDLCEELKNIFDGCRVSDVNAEVPEDAYHPNRNQYVSEPFLRLLTEKALNSDAEKLLGVTWADLFTGRFNFIFGQAQVNGRACIISLRRLSPVFYGERMDYPLLLERTVKEAVHELWHCYGMRHCENKGCVMAFSSNITGVDRKSMNICRRCHDSSEKIRAQGP